MKFGDGPWLPRVAFAAVWAVPITLSLASSQDTEPGRLAGNLSTLAFAPLFILLAAGAGDWLLDRVLRIRGPFAARHLFAAGLGLAAFSCATLALGVIALPPTHALWAALILLSFLLGRRMAAVALDARETLLDLVSGARTDAVLGSIMLLLIVAVAGMNLLRAFVPPLEYDEMEYHLAAPAKYYRDGQITFPADNAYANFPNNVEMLFLDGFILRGGVYDGFAFSRLLNVALGLLAAAAAGACAAAMFSPRAALPAAAILYTWPSVSEVTHVAYVELGLMLWAALALLAAYQYARPGRALRWLVLLALSCGLAVACKYPAALFVCVPASLWVLCRAGRRVVQHAALWLAVTLLAFSPWMVRNAVNTGNPVYPLLGGLLDGRTWSPRKDARWQRAHTARDPTLAGSWNALAKAAADRGPTGQGPLTMSFLLVAFAPLAFVRRDWRRPALALLVLAAFALLAWLIFTHRITRFLVPWLVPLVVLNAAGFAALAGRRILYVLAGACFCALLLLEVSATARVRAPLGEAYLLAGMIKTDDCVTTLLATTAERQPTYSHSAILFINRLPPGSRTLFYGEAATLYCSADLIAPTVFDENPLDAIADSARSPDDVLAALRALGVTHLYVNLAELHRFQWSYAFDYAGRHWPGYCTITRDHAFALVRDFLLRHTRPVYPQVSDQKWRDAVSTYGAEMDPRPAPGERWEEYVARALVQTMRVSERERPPRAATPFVVFELRARGQR